LWSRSQRRTAPLLCHPALSQMRTSVAAPCAATRSQHHARNGVVTVLTGRPSTKRSQIASGVVAAGRTSSP
jgi:hypothetical protein